MEYNNLIDFYPFSIFKLPDEIFLETKSWIEESIEIKNSKFAEYKKHDFANVPENQKTYHCSISPHLIEKSFWLAYTLRMCSFYYGGLHREYRLRKWDGHFDGYDMWTNFSYIGDTNGLHNHSGFLSGIIYVKNDGLATIFPEYNFEYEGKPGTMILFPSNALHYVNEKTTEEERITIAFNIIKVNLS